MALDPWSFAEINRARLFKVDVGSRSNVESPVSFTKELTVSATLQGGNWILPEWESNMRANKAFTTVRY
jgi:hypothetical protein